MCSCTFHALMLYALDESLNESEFYNSNTKNYALQLWQISVDFSHTLYK
ncbi:hypothetical protein SAMN04487979_104304 [Flavobacterium sp. ov086]|nr:hypothetical protein SAMN04487979_104304 [Flavobacterium sp. ov086]